MDKYNKFRQEHPKFIYHNYIIEEDGFSFHFSIDEYHFYPSWSFDKKLINDNQDKRFIEYLVFNIGMAELVSYWKTMCPPLVEVKCGALNDEQIKWWKKLYFGGLGEFFYRNEINPDFETFLNIHADNTTVPIFEPNSNLNGNLIAVGGGKDSIVTLELLNEYKNENLCYIINPRGATLNSAHTAGYADNQIIGVRRTLDKTMLDLNESGCLNGHTPFSSIVAFSSYLFAYLSGKKYIILSNESSANEASVNGTEINHQYSKSTSFELDFRQYTSKFFTPYPEYFSLLRPWSEWQIAKEFVKYPKYFPVFQSCNVGSKTDVWCGKCAKCLYVYIMLSAFLDDETLIAIFGSNMLDSDEFIDIFNGLVYADFNKPFECVGTKNEINLALQRALEKRKNGYIPLLLAKYAEKCDYVPDNLDTFFDSNNFVPAKFIMLLKDRMKDDR